MNPKPSSVNDIIVQAEIHPEPDESLLSSADSSDIDAIDIALGIAKDAASVKGDIRRIEQIITSNKDAQMREHNTLLELLNSIKDNVNTIDQKSDTLEEKINHLSNKLNMQEQGLSKAKHDIDALFQSISNLEKNQNRPTCALNNNTPKDVMDIDDQETVQNENCVLISNMPDRNRDEEDTLALFYVGLSLPVKDIQIKSINRTESKGGGPGNLTVQFENLEQ